MRAPVAARSSFFVLSIIPFALTSACRHHEDIKAQYNQMHAAMLNGDWAGAQAQLESSKEKVFKEDDRVMYWLNLGTLQHYAGNSAGSMENMVKAEAAMQELWTTSVSSEASKLAISDTIAPYEGEDFEKVLVYLYTAMNNVNLGKPQDAVVEARRADEMLKKMLVHYEKEGEVGTLYKQDAFMLWLVGLFYEMEGQSGYNDAFLAYKAAAKSYGEDYGTYGMGAPKFLGEDLVRTAKLVHFNDEATKFAQQTGASGESAEKLAQGMAEVIVIYGAGEAPSKEEFFIDGTMPDGYVMRIALPKFVAVPYNGTCANIRANGQQVQTELAEPISQIVLKNFEHRLPAIQLRAIARATVKYAATKVAQAAVGGGDNASGGRQLAGALVGLAGNVAAAASEAADLRSWTTLPGSVNVARIWLPAGPQTIEVEYCNVGKTETKTVDLKAGQRQIVSVRNLK